MIKKSAQINLALMLTIILAVLIAGCSRFKSTTTEFKPEIQPLPAQLKTYEAMAIPADNALTPEKVALGRELWFDTRISGDGAHSCYGCHVCEKGLTDGLPKAIGAFNKQLPRSSPTLWNIGYQKEFYWDGRSKTLEDQATAAWTKANMGAKADEIVKKLNAIPGYKEQFQQVFGSEQRLPTWPRPRLVRANDHQWRYGVGTVSRRWQCGDERERKAWLAGFSGC
jgi:cytochrome c peroxidase